MSDLVLKLDNVSKTYPGVRALDNVSFQCRAGEVHAILGENGSGKSTLMKIASGVVRPDTGSIEIGGQPLLTTDAARAYDLGLATVYQDDSLVLELTVAQNLFLATPRGAVPYGEMCRHAAQQLEALGVNISPDAVLQGLSLAQRQFVEIVKALQSNPRVLLLDEPTATLDSDGVRKLARIIKDLTTRGTGIIYVSHRLPEVLEFADRISILRDGVHRATVPVTDDLSERDLVSLMVGRGIENEYPPKPDVSFDRPVLQVIGLSGPGFNDISFTAHAGEIVGIAGAEGNGQREMLRAVVGLGKSTGLVKCDGVPVDIRSPGTAMEGGVLFLSSDRKGEAIFPDLSVQKNIAPLLLGLFSRFGFLSGRHEKRQAAGMKRDFVVAADLDTPIIGLSGGNQQKAVLARSFRSGAKAFLIDEPTQGVDAGARFEIYQAIRQNLSEGGACVINSSDGQELAGVCDRVLVVSRGRIVCELTDENLTEERIVASFLTSRDAQQTSNERPVGSVSGALSKSIDVLTKGSAVWWVPVLFLVGLTLAVSIYAALSNPVFLKPINLRHALLALAPAGLVAMAQLNVLLVRGIDVSVGAMMSLTVVLASFVMANGLASPYVMLGLLLVLALGVSVGLINGLVVRLGGVNPVITTIAMLSILQGFALIGRPTPGGLISADLTGLLNERVGFLPYSTLLLIVIAIGGDYWLHRTRSGLETKATGFREEAARRNGVRITSIHLRAFMLSGGMAALAGLFLGAQVETGHPTVGQNFALAGIAAAVLGGAALTGGRGSFSGALFGALFFTLMINIISLSGLSSAFGVIASGTMTLVAIFLYSGLSEFERVVKSLFRPSARAQLERVS
ncbi:MULTISPECIES: ATP-binding cassette domain-containing protein [unclassified Mesorhizobium]|uniref:ATP-binding cassette domain-containing protein n=1 Tax=unclassified Mesorhizobium TaxID=325217 RepID=UPI0004636BEE|nr:MULTISPECIES: ATP-binding cassette domain-containing protein [unclassified Mesorhizobium]